MTITELDAEVARLKANERYLLDQRGALEHKLAAERAARQRMREALEGVDRAFDYCECCQRRMIHASHDPEECGAWHAAYQQVRAALGAEPAGDSAQGVEELRRGYIWRWCVYPLTHPALLPEDAPIPRCGKALEEWPDRSWRCGDGHYNSPDQLIREGLGRLVREVWVVWARDQDKPKPHHLLPWEELCESGREVDRRIGETLMGIRDWRAGQRAGNSALPPEGHPTPKGEP